MKNLETYNRVKSLESPLYRNSISISYLVLALLGLSSLFSLWLLPAMWPYNLAATLASPALFALVYVFDQKQIQVCQFCGDQLGYVIRPFLLTPEYLAMVGKKQGDYFYTQCHWGRRLFTKRWAKISNRSAACHHCRLSEEKHRAFYQPVSAEELKELNLTAP